MAYNEVEVFRVIFLNSKFRVIAEETQQRGTINTVAIHPREVIKSALDNGAAAMIMVHNHPTGIVTPSQADISVTKTIRDAAKNCGIELFDHIIISKNDYFSFRDRGVL